MNAPYDGDRGSRPQGGSDLPGPPHSVPLGDEPDGEVGHHGPGARPVDPGHRTAPPGYAPTGRPYPEERVGSPQTHRPRPAAMSSPAGGAVPSSDGAADAPWPTGEPGPSRRQPPSGGETLHLNPAAGEGGPRQPGQGPGQHDAFAYLYRDQQRQPPPPPATAAPPTEPTQPVTPPPTAEGPAAEERSATPRPAPEQPPPRRRGGRAAGILKSSAVMAAGTLVSRVTGFIRQLVIIAALGGALLGDTYTVAMSLPTMIYILTIGGGLNSVFVPQLVRAMKNDEDNGEAYANRLLTLVMVILGGLVVLSVLAAPLLIRLMSVKIAEDPAANDVAVTFARFCLPTIFFMGVHVVLGQVLNARGYFGPMMWTPVLNNIVVIFTFAMFIWVYGTQSTSRMGVTTISPEGVRLLGVGTLLGLTVQALAMLPYLRNAGFRVRPRFDWRGHGMGKAARLAKWTVFFVLANQAGLVIVSQLATWAGEDAAAQGYPGSGYIGYNSALLIWQMPQAIITVSVMAALLPRISRAAADEDAAAVRDDLSQGLRTSAVAIVPIAFAFVALGVPLCTLIFGPSGEDSARSIGYILMAFGLGLIPFSAQYVVLRAFYAYEDTRTPFYNTVIVSASWAALSGLCFLVLPARWVVAGIGFSYGVAYAIGVLVAWRRLRPRLNGDMDGPRVVRTYTRLAGASLPAAVVGGGVGYAVLGALGTGVVGSLTALLAGSVVLLALFYVAARRMRIEELTAMVGMIRARLGR